jgi:hypothetical protein
MGCIGGGIYMRQQSHVNDSQCDYYVFKTDGTYERYLLGGVGSPESQSRTECQYTD